MGPGSFTGLRVGMRSVQGLALAAGKPCVGVASLDVLGRLLAADASAAVVADVDWRVLKPAYEMRGRRHLFDRVGPAQPRG